MNSIYDPMYLYDVCVGIGFAKGERIQFVCFCLDYRHEFSTVIHFQIANTLLNAVSKRVVKTSMNFIHINDVKFGQAAR